MPRASKKPAPKKYPTVCFRALRLSRYQEAIRARRARQPDLSEADWFREACDLLAERDLTESRPAE
jgi:hypothetical protein